MHGARTLTRRIVVASALAVMSAGIAMAETAWTTKTLNLRAGPGRDYPLVSRLPAGAEVEVAGCLNDWNWCDVIAGPERGWAWAGALEYPYEGRRVVILHRGAYIGLPIVPWVPGTYWDNYYVGRPWYGRRSYWVGRPYVGHPFVGRPGVVVRPGVVRPGVVRPGRPGVVRGPRPEGPRPRAVERARPVGPRPQSPGRAPAPRRERDRPRGPHGHP